MTTGRPRSSERTTFRGLRCLQTPFGQALRRRVASTQPPAVGMAISTTSSDPAAPNDLPPTDNPGSTGTNGRA